jgi:hypothetical protein
MQRLVELIKQQRDVWENAGQLGKRVLLASIGHGRLTATIDAYLAAGLHIRGADVHLALCDGVLTACEPATVRGVSIDTLAGHGPQESLCERCHVKVAGIYESLGLPFHRYSQWISPERRATLLNDVQEFSIEDCCTYQANGINLGEQVQAGLLRCLGRECTDDDPRIVALARRYLAGALITVEVVERMIEDIKPDSVVAHHGMYVPQGIVHAVARRHDIPTAAWGTSYRNGSFIWGRNDTYHKTLLHDREHLWVNMEWTKECEQRIDQYLAYRRQGKGDWSWMAHSGGGAPIDTSRIWNELGLDANKPTACLLTNIMYDAALFFESKAYPRMMDWLVDTVRHFHRHPEQQLIIRIHPHEHQNDVCTQFAEQELRAAVDLPGNVAIVPSKGRLNSYDLAQLSNAVLLYGSITGVELAPLGLPVIVAGEAWIRGKGITHDVNSRMEYHEWLTRLNDIKRLDDCVIQRAKRFAYYYFFMRMIPLSGLDTSGWPPKVGIKSLTELRPGHDPGLDAICRSILEDRDFVFDPTDMMRACAAG